MEIQPGQGDAKQQPYLVNNFIFCCSLKFMLGKKTDFRGFWNFQNAQIFQQSISLFPEQSTLPTTSFKVRIQARLYKTQFAWYY
jgi:hypothetical protein